MRVLLLVLIYLCSVIPLVAQTSLLPTVERLRAAYPAKMSEAQVGELLNRVAWEHRSEGWGLLRKTGGTRCPVPQGGEASCDILIHAPSVRHFDVLSDVEGAAAPVWRDAGPCVISPSSGCEMARFLAPVQPAGQPEPPQPPQPPAPDPQLEQRLSQLEQNFADLRQIMGEHFQQIAQINQRQDALILDTDARLTLLQSRVMNLRCSARGRVFGVIGVGIDCEIPQE